MLAVRRRFCEFIQMLKERGMENLDDVNKMNATSPETVMKLPTYHAIILATNDIGRINLYRLVSMSHLTYYNKRPRIPKSELVKYREGLLLGSACEAGELYRALVNGRPEEEIARLVKFYDYLEIQPLGNNEFMLRSDKEPVNSREELMDLNRRIVQLGETFHKLVVATCDVHFWTRRMKCTAGLSWQERASRMQTSRHRYFAHDRRDVKGI